MGQKRNMKKKSAQQNSDDLWKLFVEDQNRVAKPTCGVLKPLGVKPHLSKQLATSIENPQAAEMMPWGHLCLELKPSSSVHQLFKVTILGEKQLI